MPASGTHQPIDQPQASDSSPHRRTLDSLREGFQIIGVDWTYVYVNPVAAHHGQSTPERLTGRIIWDAYPGIEQTPLFQVMREVMENRGSRVFENYFKFPDGHGRWFEIRIQAVPEGICIYSADIHERKMAELHHKADTERPTPLRRRFWATWSRGIERSTE